MSTAAIRKIAERLESELVHLNDRLGKEFAQNNLVNSGLSPGDVITVMATQNLLMAEILMEIAGGKTLVITLLENELKRIKQELAAEKQTSTKPN